MNSLHGILVVAAAICLNVNATTANTSPSADSIHISLPDSVPAVLHFAIGSSVVNPMLSGNAAVLDTIADAIDLYSREGRDFSVNIIGLASPDGGNARNMQLARQRGESAYSRIEGRSGNRLVQYKVRNGGINWLGLRSVIEASSLPEKDAILDVLAAIRPDGSLPEGDRARLVRMNGGRVWRMLNRRVFPDLRVALVTVVSPPREATPPELVAVYDDEKADTATVQPSAPVATVEYAADTVAAVETATDVDEPEVSPRKPFYMSVSTNMLYDALLVPNIGVEFYLGKQWSVGANWMYGWWDSNRRHRYWRIYGGDITVRRWFGRKSEEKPLTGHHAGVYAQALTYDFEFGGKGYMAGTPGGSMWDRCSYGAGVEYGYALPITRHLNIDFTIGVGYFGGTYYEYIPEDGHYVWQSTKRRHWFGPTKAQVSLVWLLGRGNCNKKGGRK